MNKVHVELTALCTMMLFWKRHCVPIILTIGVENTPRLAKDPENWNKKMNRTKNDGICK